MFKFTLNLSLKGFRLQFIPLKRSYDQSQTSNIVRLKQKKKQVSDVLIESCGTAFPTGSFKMCMALMGRLYLISGGYQGVRELPGQDLEENDSIGIDIRLEAVRVVILHPDDLRSLWTYRQNKQINELHFRFPFIALNGPVSLTVVKSKLRYSPSRGWIRKAAPPDASRSTWPSPLPDRSRRFSPLALHAGRCLRCCQGSTAGGHADPDRRMEDRHAPKPPVQKDTVGLHVPVNDVLRVQIATNGNKKRNDDREKAPRFRGAQIIVRRGLTPSPGPSAGRCL